jgi:sugar phosphate isomerase/epimerase
MQIRYVVSTMVFWWRENKLSLEQECRFLDSLGFGVELWPNIKGDYDCRYSRQNWERLREATEGMLVSMRSRNDDPTLEQWREQIECAKMLDAHIVTDLQSFGIPEGTEINGCDFSREVTKIAADNEVEICLETGSLDRVLEVAERFENLRYCLDTGFANVEPRFDFRQYVDKLAERVTHLHLCDNYGRVDDHEPAGLKGGISRENWDYLLNSVREYDSDIVGSLEMCPCSPAAMIRQACGFIFDELDWPNRPSQSTDNPISIYDSSQDVI